MIITFYQRRSQRKTASVNSNSAVAAAAPTTGNQSYAVQWPYGENACIAQGWKYFKTIWVFRHTWRLHPNDNIKHWWAFVILHLTFINTCWLFLCCNGWTEMQCVCAQCSCTLLPLWTEISPGEKEDLELLERALEKAFCVRTGSGHQAKKPNKPSAPLKDPRASAVPPKEGRQTSAAPSGKQINRTTSKSGRLDKREQKKTGLSKLTSVSRLSEDKMFTCLHTWSFLMFFFFPFLF